jgi:hypothetical protein
MMSFAAAAAAAEDKQQRRQARRRRCVDGKGKIRAGIDCKK